MPNWVNNRVYMRGIGRNKNLYNENGEFDFNTIIPMPETIMKSSSGSMTDITIELVLYLAQKRYERYNSFEQKIYDKVETDFELLQQNQELNKSVLMAIEWIRRGKNISFEDAFVELVKMGVMHIYNMCMYTYPEWYDWSCRNWSTKWNASSTEIIDDNCIEFNTPWSIPYNILRVLSEIHPYDEITVDWFEEGGICGVTSFHNGDLIHEDVHQVIWDSVYDYEKGEYRNNLFTVMEGFEEGNDDEV